MNHSSHQFFFNRFFLRIILSGFLMNGFSVFANPPLHEFYRSQNSTAPGGWIFNIWSAFSYSHYKAQPGNLNISFPYILTPSGGTPASHVFSSQSDDLIKRGKFVYPAIGLEAGKENFSVEAEMGLYIHYWSDNLYAGFNYRFILRRVHDSPQKITLGSVSFPGKNTMRGAASFPVKLSLGLFYFQPLWKLGNIDVGNTTFKSMGYTMQDLDSASTGNNGNITVYFHQNIVALKPAISIGFQPEETRFIFNFTASPLIILSEVGGLRFYLNNSGNVDWVPRNGIDPDAVIPLSTFGMNATFNGEQLSSSPFKLQGWMFSLKIGIRLTGDYP